MHDSRFALVKRGGATGLEPVTLPCQIQRASAGLYVGWLGIGKNRQKAAGERRYQGPERSDDPPLFSNGRVGPYGGRLLPVCCPDSPAYIVPGVLPDLGICCCRVSVAAAWSQMFVAASLR
jgi:hypothetical protein